MKEKEKNRQNHTKEERAGKADHSREEKADRRKQRVFAVILIVLLLGIAVAVCLEVGKPLVQFVSDSEQLRSWVNENWLWSRLAYIGIVMLQIVVAFIPGEPFEIAAGYAFGAVEGTIICMLGSVLGGTLVFLLVKKFGVKLVEVFISVDKINSLKFLRDSKKRDILMFPLFFIPGTPKDALTYFAGLTTMDLKTWLIITTIAKIPSIITSTVGGDAIGMANYQFAIIVFVVTFLISGAGLLFYNHFTKKKQKEADGSTECEEKES